MEDGGGAARGLTDLRVFHPVQDLQAFLTGRWRIARRISDPRLGLAVPKAAGNAVVRNRIKRKLREIWRAKLDADAVPATHDYVLVVRAGLPEAAEARGHEWLTERVDEVLGKVAA